MKQSPLPFHRELRQLEDDDLYPVLVVGDGKSATYDPRQRLDRALEALQRSFPFEGSVGVGPQYFWSLRGHRLMAEAVMRHLRSGCILDFGAGACHKSSLMAFCGYRVYACDDLCDEWHLQDDNRRKIMEYARRMGVDFFLIEPGRNFPYFPEQFDMVLMNAILEHLHHSPRELLCQVLEWVKPGGFILITVPNAANLRKRAALLLGSTNYPQFEYFFWETPWRGHVREYVLSDLKTLCRLMQLEVVELRGIHEMLDDKIKGALARYLYLGLTAFMPGARDSLLLVARKPATWSPQQISEKTALPDLLSTRTEDYGSA
jgi:SAM-dependent methyltransferase